MALPQLMALPNRLKLGRFFGQRNQPVAFGRSSVRNSWAPEALLV